MYKTIFLYIGIAFFATAIVSEAWAQQCPESALMRPKGNTVYLYFPTSSDNTFPEYDDNADTSPLGAFDVGDLDSGIGSTADLRDRIFEIVTDDYCEFNVEIIQTTSNPSPSEDRWQIVGIGSDAETIFGGNLFGVAQDVDIGDNDAQDYARVYAESFGNAYGGSGEALNGTNSTLERWARAIGHTTSHEAGHNYGLSHGDSAPRSGTNEDGQNNHILATGGTGLTGEQRASRVRHFSDTGYEIMAHNIGLNLKTLHNWDFVNPNDEDAHSLELTLLSEASSLSIDWFYTGSRSPWTNPSITNTGSTQSFQGTTYNVFELTFSDPKSWNGGSDGIAPPGTEFHVGATFNESDAVIVYDTKVKDNTGDDLDLHPRMMGYDAGTSDLSSGDFDLAFFNPNPEDGELIIENIQIRYLSRIADIETMIADDTLQGLRGQPIELRRPSPSYEPVQSFKVEDQVSFRLAQFTDKRSVDITYDSTDCERGYSPPAGPQDVDIGEIQYCPDGTALSLFPATSVYMTATVVDPNAKYFDPDAGEFVNGPLESQVFYQFAGFVPDFNDNGTDDLLDIRSRTSADENGNGIPDEGEISEPDEDQSYTILWWILILIIILIIIFLLFRKRS